MKLLLAFAGIVLVTALLVWVKARTHEAQAESSFPPEGQFVDVDGTRVHAVVRGAPEAPPLVLIHGASGNTRDWTLDIVPRLATSYRVIVFDRPGLGYTDSSRGSGAGGAQTISEQATLLQAAAATLGADKPVVLGHSYGGAVALAWAVHHPEHLAALVTVAAASHRWETGLSTYYKILSHPILGPLVIPFLTAFVPDARVEREIAAVFEPDAVPKGYLDHFGAGLTLRRTSMRANALQRANLLDEITVMTKQYPDIKVPVEVLHGTADMLVWSSIHSEPLARAIPDATLTLLPGTGHMPHHAVPDEITDAIHRAFARAGIVEPFNAKP
ncbi:MAG: alpha/beta hydrolase [Pseudomonadota bacterium]